MIRLNNKWEFTYTWTDDFMKGFIDGETIRLPHNISYLPLHNAQPIDGEMSCGYRHTIEVPKEIIGQKVFLIFDGVAPACEVFLNHESVGMHEGGFARFSFDISEQIRAGKNTIAVRVDCLEKWNAEGHASFDFATCAGMYRDAWLDIRPNTYIKDVSVSTIDDNRIKLDIETVGEPMIIDAEIYDEDGSLIASEKNCGKTSEIYISQAHHWNMENPYIYKCVVYINSEDGEDYYETTFGIRTAKFESDGFYLNGEKVFLRGFNRHQIFPYVGYATTESLQREDARILKEELRVTCVRCWHYPPNEYFIDECDKQGICVLMDVTDAGFFENKAEDNKEYDKEISEAEASSELPCPVLLNAREQFIQFKNHPSIIAWGIGLDRDREIAGTEDESAKEKLSDKLNEMAHEIDPSRPTYGITSEAGHAIKEDIFGYNDYSHNGGNFGCLSKRKVLAEPVKPYIITEAAGHMFPAKSFDDPNYRQEHALYHARVLDASMSMGGIAGCIMNSFTDYNSTKNFGSGDNVCYHGVMDAFRNPKTAARFYESQSNIEDTFMAAADYSAEHGLEDAQSDAVLFLSTSFNHGDYPSSKLGSIYAFTNADEVNLYKDGELVGTNRPRDWDSLSHGPIEIQDTIGHLIEKNENVDVAGAELIKKCFAIYEQHGISNLPIKEKSQFNYCLKKNKISTQDFINLYNKYVTNYGRSVSWHADAIKDGKIVKSANFTQGGPIHIEAIASKVVLTEGSCYDMALVRIRIVDENGNLATYTQMPVAFATEGVVDVMGPMVATAEGGMCGTIVRTTGWDGYGKLLIYTEGGMETEVDFTVVILEEN